MYGAEGHIEIEVFENAVLARRNGERTKIMIEDGCEEPINPRQQRHSRHSSHDPDRGRTRSLFRLVVVFCGGHPSTKLIYSLLLVHRMSP